MTIWILVASNLFCLAGWFLTQQNNHAITIQRGPPDDLSSGSNIHDGSVAAQPSPQIGMCSQYLK